MKFFNIDLHISVIADISNIFKEIGHSIDINYLSDHSWVFDKLPNNSFCINQFNWKSISPSMCNEFYDKYKDKLDSYDGFIVTHIPALSLLFEKFNKPIIFVASTRYEYPFTDDLKRWQWFNDFINSNKNIVFVANNLYDKWYCESFLNKKFTLIPSLCEYTNVKYTGKIKKSLLSSKFLTIDDQKIVNKNNLGRYTWSHICDYESIIHIPYNVSTMSIFENYTSNIPMFFPDKNLNFYLAKRGFSMTELSYNQVLGMNPKSTLSLQNKLDPNNFLSEEVINKAIDFSDFYNDNMKEVIYFSDVDDLFYKMKNLDFGEVSKKMHIHNIERKQRIVDDWKKIIEKI